MALWNTLLCASSTVSVFHSPPSRVRMSRRAGPGFAVAFPSTTWNCEYARSSPFGSELGMPVAAAFFLGASAGFSSLTVPIPCAEAAGTSVGAVVSPPWHASTKNNAQIPNRVTA